VLTRVTPGASVDVLVTDHGIAVNPARQDLIDNLRNAGIPLMTIEELQQRAELLTGKPKAIEFTDRVVAVVRYRDGSVIDVIHQVKTATKRRGERHERRVNSTSACATRETTERRRGGQRGRARC
jgi:citrate lyase subunit alpha/citrate CoA-transferase